MWASTFSPTYTCMYTFYFDFFKHSSSSSSSSSLSSGDGGYPWNLHTMLGNQFKWEETVTSKVGDQASAGCVSSIMWLWHRALTQRSVDFQVAIISKQTETPDCTPFKILLRTYNIIYDIQFIILIMSNWMNSHNHAYYNYSLIKLACITRVTRQTRLS